MYKVFVNNCPIILTNDIIIVTKFRKENFENCNISKIINLLFENRLKGICLICNDLDSDWKKFQSTFKIQKAAGGKVINDKNEILFIYRLGKWDLPKGKLERNETINECAIREVEEECGISNLKIIKPLETTYHIFERNGKLIFKITYWFLMSTVFKGKLIPQIEENIEHVEFKNERETKSAMQNTYENIKLIVDV